MSNEFIARKGLIAYKSSSFQETIAVTGSVHIASGSSVFIKYDFQPTEEEVLSFSKQCSAVGGLTETATFVNLGGGVMEVQSGSCRFYENSDYAKWITRRNMPASTTFSFAPDELAYIATQYNSGSPQYIKLTDYRDINESDVFPAYTLYRDGATNDFHGFDWGHLGRALPNKLHQRLTRTDLFAREDGLVLSVTGSAIRVSPGTVWVGTSKKTTVQLDSSVPPLFRVYHHSGSNGWTYYTSSTFDNLHYDDGTTTQSLSNNRYATNWIYQHVDSDDIYPSTTGFIVLGRTNNSNLAEVQAEQPPSSLPPILTGIGLLTGRIIVEKSASAPTQVDSAFAQIFSPSGITRHIDLVGLDFASSGHTGFVGTSQTASMTVLSSSFASTASYFSGTVTSASYAVNASTASYVVLAQTASYIATASWANNAVLSLTASYVVNAQTASYAALAQTASYVILAQTASYVATASWAFNAVTASYIILAQTASYVVTAQTASFVATASWALKAVTASYVATASWAQNVITASYAITASYVATASYAVSGGWTDIAQTASVLATSINYLGLTNAVRTGSFSLAATNTWYDLPFNLDVVTSSYFDHVNNSAAFTCSSDGFYQFSYLANVVKTSGGSSQVSGLRILKDGLGWSGSYVGGTYSSNNSNQILANTMYERILSGSTFVLQIAGDSTNIQVQQFPTSSLVPATISYSAKLIISRM